MTLILIAHRLSTIMHADLIYVLKAGKILESGNHTELLARQSYYYEMWKKQVPELDKLKIA
jgi:ATP-binding cassette subfamily B protein